jgi:hypothetical protein
MVTQEVMDFCRDFDQAAEVRELESSGDGEVLDVERDDCIK